MADAMRQIRQDLDHLENAVADLAKDFDRAYDTYLGTLRDSLQKQVILACYHLCTRSYPEQFLQLSFRQRERLQQAIQAQICETQQRLMHAYVLATIQLADDDDESPTWQEKLRSLPSSGHSLIRRSRNSDAPDSGDDHSSIEFIAITNLDSDDALTAAKDPLLAAALAEFAESLALDEKAIVKRVKQELLRQASSPSPSSNDADDDETSDDSDDEATSENEASESDAIDDGPIDGDLHQTSTDAIAHPLEPGSERSHPDPIDPSAASTSPTAGLLSAAPVSQEHQADEQPSLNDTDSVESDVTQPDATSPDSEPQDEASAAALDALANPDNKTFSSCDTLLTPEVLSLRQDQFDENVTELLHTLSRQINHELHESSILPKKLPEAILDAALKADVASESVGGPPNILNLVVEAEGKSSDAKVMRITALRLRPPELEFHDPQLSACRSRLRELTGKLHKLGKEYHKKQRAWAIAEAESAWRSSWYEKDN